ncbi:GNAT family N-acetyltransferase [Tamlana crocina]|uniref:GNAT family N-acetyltransferase n=1 Tax=Tamlana crocina TaxID=393006 RepID=A0ABX1DD36_9FLAO|nr:GNAT family N-acetyltransferase [Tamlana crocina]NJX14533.1 GNAT family N-acetyltransferase [Tamlana crocina]
MNFNIKQIPSEETHSVRHPILRAGHPIESCVFDGDNLETTFHIGIFSESKLLGVCSFFKNNSSSFSEKKQYQLRGMAIVESHQKQGLGQLLIKHGENILKTKHAKLVWCNARETATPFYTKNGYKITGDPYNIKTVGIHYLMYKPL